jgi:ArsR family transcriptional regulator, arsenate/arsenite/antimonite-responsive transcriptional repressor
MPAILKNRKVTARWFHAFADETRLAIIERLSEGEQCVCDLTDMLETGQSRLSFHLKTLKDAGIVKDRRDGRWIYYSLNAEEIQEVEEFLRSVKSMTQRVRSESKCCD